MKYKFEQFNIEIIDPIIEVDLNTIRDMAIDKNLSVDVIFIVNSTRFGVIAENMPYELSWNDTDIQGMVENWLKQYEVWVTTK